MEQRESPGAVRIGMIWGGVGAVIGFLVSLVGSLAGVVAAGFIGFSCGRRAAGTLSGLVAGAVAAPAFVIGAAAGALIAARRVGVAKIATTLSEMLGTRISPDEAWQLFVLSLGLAAFFQAALLILASTAAGAWAARKR